MFLTLSACTFLHTKMIFSLIIFYDTFFALLLHRNPFVIFFGQLVIIIFAHVACLLIYAFWLQRSKLIPLVCARVKCVRVDTLDIQGHISYCQARRGLPPPSIPPKPYARLLARFKKLNSPVFNCLLGLLSKQQVHDKTMFLNAHLWRNYQKHHCNCFIC